MTKTSPNRCKICGNVMKLTEFEMGHIEFCPNCQKEFPTSYVKKEEGQIKPNDIKVNN